MLDEPLPNLPKEDVGFPVENSNKLEGTGEKRKLNLAIAGCSHGEMDVIYATLEEIERQNGYKFDLLICCGDYQSVRNYGDLEQMHVNDKYKQLRTFYKYYNGEKVAPILTLFVGGNHEASGYLCELPNGGWVAPRIYYMGFSNVIRFAGLRIGGLSGIYKSFDFQRGHYERPPFTNNSIISAYHVRNLDVWRLRQMRAAEEQDTENSLDIMITHDWPCGITDYGDVDQLLRFKPHFREDIKKNCLGNPSTMNLLSDTKPKYWFSAHLHCMFAALVPHRKNEQGHSAEPTRFLALNKPIPRRHFVHALQLDIESDANTTDLFYDAKWLAVLRNTNFFTSISEQKSYLPSSHSSERFDFRPTAEELAEIDTLGDLKIPENFKRTAEPCSGAFIPNALPSPYYRNPQSTQFCKWLGIQDLNQLLADSDTASLGTPYYLLETLQTTDPGEIKIDDDELFGAEDFIIDTAPTNTTQSQTSEAFQAPAWRGGVPEVSGDTPLLKRRKVDFNEDE